MRARWIEIKLAKYKHTPIPGHEIRFGAHPLWVRWQGMHARCSNQNHTGYHNYGGKGVRVCQRWRDFGLFVADMGMPKDMQMSIERENSSKDYCPENCRWAYSGEQSRNTKRNIWVTVGDCTLTVSDWELKNGVSSGAYSMRIRRGWDHIDAVTLPVEPGKPLWSRNKHD